MSLLVGIAFIGISVLSLRWLKHWYARHDRTGGLANGLVVNFVLPTLAATLMSGVIVILLAFLDGITLVDVAATAFMSGLIVVAWRGMGREKRLDNVVPLTPGLGAIPASHPTPDPTPVKAPRHAA